MDLCFAVGGKFTTWNHMLCVTFQKFHSSAFQMYALNLSGNVLGVEDEVLGSL